MKNRFRWLKARGLMEILLLGMLKKMKSELAELDFYVILILTAP